MSFETYKQGIPFSHRQEKHLIDEHIEDIFSADNNFIDPDSH